MPKMSREDEFRKSLERAISIAGSQRALGRAIGIHPQTISLALSDGKGLKGIYALRIEKFTNGDVKRHEIDPEAYPPEEYKFLKYLYK